MLSVRRDQPFLRTLFCERASKSHAWKFGEYKLRRTTFTRLLSAGPKIIPLPSKRQEAAQFAHSSVLRGTELATCIPCDSVKELRRPVDLPTLG
jgi:hypothetical protein